MYRFRVTVEPLDTEGAPLVFEAVNHDDIVAIARRMPGRFGLGEAEAHGLAIGMKLFGETVLRHRAEAPFSEIRPAMREFMMAVKAAKTAPGE